MSKLWLALLLAAGLLPVYRAFAQDEVKISTLSAKPQREESPLTFNIEKDRYDSRVGLDYSLRWDFSDLKHFRPGLSSLAAGIAAVGRWDITENTKVKYYGFSTNPWRLIIAREKVNGNGPAPSGSAIVGGGEKAVYRKRVRLSLSPLVDDVRRDLDENLRNILLDSSFSTLSPEWRKVSRHDKKDFFQDVLSLDIWAVPGLDETKKGLDYISK